MAMSVAVQGSRTREPELDRFDLTVFQNDYATEFVLPLRVNIDSGIQRASLTLGIEKLQARVLARVQPQNEAAAYLVATIFFIFGLKGLASPSQMCVNAPASIRGWKRPSMPSPCDAGLKRRT